MHHLWKFRSVLVTVALLQGAFRLCAQTCSTQEFEAKAYFHSEALPIEMSGFFPYVLHGSNPARKFTTESWTGNGMAIAPSCGCFTYYSDVAWSGNWAFSAVDFTDTSSKLVTYLRQGCGDPGPIPFVEDQLKIGLLDSGGIATPPITSTTDSSHECHLPDPPSYSSCIFGLIPGSTQVNEDLSSSFTLEQAKIRAETYKTIGSDSLQYWNNNFPATDADVQNGYNSGTLTRTSPITAHANRVSFQARFAGVSCLGNGKFILTFYYKHWAQGQPEPATCEIDSDEVTFKDPPFIYPQDGGYKKYKFDLVQGEQCKLVRVVARKMCDMGEAGDGAGKNKCVDMLYQLGKRTDGNAAGALEIYADTVAAELYTPATLQLIAGSDPSVTVVRQDGNLRQVYAPTALVDIVTTSADSYELRYYLASQVGALDGGTGLYTLSGQPYVTHRIENPDTGSPGVTNRIRFTETRGSAQKVTLYAYDSATGKMDMTVGNGLRTESLTKTVSGSNVTETRTETDGSSNVSSVTRENKFQFPFGLNVVDHILDPAGAALATHYTYYEDSVNDGGAYGQVKTMVEPSGRWTSYTYDSQGRPADTVTQFLNSVIGTPASQNRVTSTTWSTVADLDGDGLPETLSTTVDSLLGQETGRSFELIYSKPQIFNAQTVEVRAEIKAVTAGAAWNAADNLVTQTQRIQGGVLDLKPMSELAPDQTLTLYQYDLTSTSLTTTVWHGQPNAAKTAVVAGTKTVTTNDLFGNLLSATTSDVASALPIAAQVVTTADSFGRPTRIDYDDGTYELRSYACCGLGSVTDRMGMTTTYSYDDLGRVFSTARAGLVTLNAFDADGRILTISRKGMDDSIILQQTNTYDLAGRQTSSKDALNRTTLFSEVKNGSGNTVRTTTMPDLSTTVVTSAPDGSVLSSLGNAAAQQLSYEYNVDADGAYTKEIHMGSSGETTEWVKSSTDLAGRGYKKVYADGATEQSYYNSLGQLVKSVDADGITMLYAYNLRGEQETSALDFNRDGGINYDGTDRVTHTVIDVATHGSFTVQRTTTQVWETDNHDTPNTISMVEQAVDGLHSWQTVRGLSTNVVTTLDGTGGRTVVSTAPDNTVTTQVYANDRLTSTVTQNGSVGTLSSITYGYDPQGRLQNTTDARNGATTYTYYADDQLNSVTTPDPDATRSGDGYDPQTTTYTYDGSGRQSQVTQPDATVVNTTYWPTGAVKRTWGSRTYPTEYAYDAQGRVKTLTTWQDFSGDAGKSVTTWNYNSLRGWLDDKHYADGTGPSYTYTPSGRLLTRVWVRNVTTTYGYNNAGDLTGVSYSDGTTPSVAIIFDRAGRPQTMTDGAGARTLSYQTSGQLQDEIYSAGLLSGYSVERDYDSLNRLSSISAANGSPITSSSYGYDAASRLHVVTQGSHTATYAYVPNSALVQSVTIAQGGTTRLVTTKNYDNLNRLSSINHAPSVSAATSVAYTYNSANQRIKAAREDATYWGYGYDALGQVTSGRKHLADDSVILGHDYSWTYDDIGNRKTSTTNSNLSTYTANNLNEYSSSTVPSTVEAFGTADSNAVVTVNSQATQRQGAAWYVTLPYANAYEPSWIDLKIKGVLGGGASGGADAVSATTRHLWLPKTPEVYGYDEDGNLKSDGRWSYSWDGENRLIAMETRSDLLPPAGPFPLAQHRRLEFGYDGQGRRISKKVFNWSPGGWVLAKSLLFVYDDWNLIAEMDAINSNAAIRTYVWGLDLSGSRQGAGGVGGLLSVTSGGATYGPAYDGNGNVIGLVDVATGMKSATYDYNAFGLTTQSEGFAALANPWRFSTKYTDDETGLLYYGLRYYNSTIGRWLNRDSIGESGGVNIYGFVHNEPILRYDILGMLFARGSETVESVGHLSDSRRRGETSPSNPIYKNRLKYPDRPGDCFELILEGTLKNTIVYASEADKKSTDVDGTGRTVHDHEHHHAEINTEHWDKFASDANEYEDRYCSQNCGQAAKEVVTALFGLYQAERDAENNQFDWDAYASDPNSSYHERISRAMLEDPDNIRKAKENVAAKILNKQRICNQ